MLETTLIRLNIPQEALKFILLQRCDLQKIGGKVYFSKFNNFLYRIYEENSFMRKLYRWYASAQLEPILRSKDIIDSYSAMMRQEMELIRPYLPSRGMNILNIGCGVGGLDVLLFNYYSESGIYPELYLMDKSGISDEIVYGYHEEAANYNSLAITRRLLEANNVPGSHVHLIEASDFTKADIPGVDLVLSLQAWGFHFPVHVYMDRVFELMQPHAHLIIDIRQGSEGVEFLKRYFKEYAVIFEHERYLRVLVKKS